MSELEIAVSCGLAGAFMIAAIWGDRIIGKRKSGEHRPPDKLEPQECYCAKLRPDSRARGAHCAYCHANKLCGCDDKKVARFRSRKGGS